MEVAFGDQRLEGGRRVTEIDDEQARKHGLGNTARTQSFDVRSRPSFEGPKGGFQTIAGPAVKGTADTRPEVMPTVATNIQVLHGLTALTVELGMFAALQRCR